MDAEWKYEVFRQYPQMIYVTGIDQILLRRVYLNSNPAIAKELNLDLLLYCPRHVAAVTIHSVDGDVLNGPPGIADLTAAYGETIPFSPPPASSIDTV